MGNRKLTMKSCSKLQYLLLGILAALLLVANLDKISGIVTFTTPELLYDPRVRKWNITNLNNQFHLITMLSLYCGNRWPGYEKFSLGELNLRDEEYLRTLQSNLQHPLIKEIHLLYTDDQALNVLRQQKMINREKIFPVKMQRRIHMMDFFHYASKYLLDKPVIALNGDIAVGEGFDLIDTTKMRDNKVLYTLTRHGHSEGNCSVDNYCVGLKYQGSHDTHIFRLAEPLDEKLLLRLDYPINMWQAENGMIGAFTYLFNFNVYNPCRVLKTYHHHCSPVHKQGKTNSIKDHPYYWRIELLAKAEPIDELLY